MSNAIKINLSDKIILISGGYGHLGGAITENLLAHDAKVYVLGRSKEKFLAKFRSETDKLLFHSCDISVHDEFIKVFEYITKKEGRIDVVINNALYSKGRDPENLSDEDWSTGVDGALSSVFRSIKAIIPYFKKQKQGKIINVTSMYGLIAPDFEIYDEFPNFLNPPHYGASKAGVIQLTKYYASYLGKYNVNVNCVSPGPFPSDKVQEHQEFLESLKSKTALGRIGLREDLAGIFTFLASDAANYITGQNFTVDGGWTVKS